MKQTVEEAAREYCKKNFQHLEHLHLTVETAFEAGADWQAKQSLWISVEDAVPKPSDESDKMCEVKYKDGTTDVMPMRNVYKWVRPYLSEDSVTHWRPITNETRIV